MGTERQELNTQISNSQIDFYCENGYLVVEDLLDRVERAGGRNALAVAIEQHLATNAHNNQAQGGYYKDVFVQCVNLWKTNDKIRQSVVDPCLGKMAAELAGVDGVRLYHDQSLVKQPWANPTNWHVDNPSDPFHSRQSIMLWAALDDATLQNECLYFLPGTLRTSSFDVAVIGNLGEAKVDSLLDCYPGWAGIEPVAVEVKAGGGIFISGMIAHAACPNMTIHPRRVLAMLFMPCGSVYNGQPAALPAKYAAKLAVGELLDDDEHLPLLYATG